MDSVPTTITFVDAKGQPKNIRKTPGGMIPYDLMEVIKLSGGKSIYQKVFGSFVTLMMWPNGVLKVVVFGKELIAFPATIRPTKASNPAQAELPLEGSTDAPQGPAQF